MSLDHTMRNLVREVLEDVIKERVPSEPAPVALCLPAYVDVKEAARIAGVHAQTIRSWIGSGALGTYRAGTHHRVKLSEFETYLARDGRPAPAIDFAERAREILSRRG